MNLWTNEMKMKRPKKKMAPSKLTNQEEECKTQNLEKILNLEKKTVVKSNFDALCVSAM